VACAVRVVNHPDRVYVVGFVVGRGFVTGRGFGGTFGGSGMVIGIR